MERTATGKLLGTILIGIVPLLCTASAVGQGPVLPPPGLVGWWALDGDFEDFGPSALTGAAGGTGGSFVTACVGEGFRAAGLGGHVAVADAPPLDVSRSFTIECWVRVDALGVQHMYLANKGYANHRLTPYTFGVMGASAVFPVSSGASRTGLPGPGRPFVTLSDGSLEQVVFADRPVPLGMFTHLACTVTPSGAGHQCRIFMNGVQVGFSWLSRLPFDSGLPLQIGGVAGGPYTVNGIIDEVTLYGRALTGVEVQTIFVAGANGKLKPQTDTEPPIVQITSPSAGAILSSAVVPVQASILDDSPTQVVSAPTGLNVALPAGGGIASGDVPLTGDGGHSIAVQAVDSAGNAAATSVNVIVDTTPPLLTVAPGNGTIFGLSPAPFTISVTDLTATTVAVGGQVRILPSGGGTVVLDVPLVEGVNTVSIDVVDGAGHGTQLVRSVVLDLSTPLVTILDPADGSLFGTGQESIAVLARVDDLTATSVISTPMGVAAQLPAGGGLASGVVALREGLNQITVTATDDVGRVGEAVVTVNLDSTAPTVSFAGPETGDLLAGTVEVLATAIDVAPGSGIAQIDLFDGTALLGSSAGATLRLDVDTRQLTDGDHTLRVVAMDGAGNQGVALLPVTVDNTPPSLRVIVPTAGATISGIVPFEVIASDAGSGLVSVTPLVGGQAPPLNSPTAFSSRSSGQVLGSVDTTQWPNGPLQFTAEARDSAGNQSVDTIEVMVDNVVLASAPGLWPRDGARVRGNTRLKVASDLTGIVSMEIQVDGRTVASGVRSPLVVRFDTRVSIDGPMEIRGIVRTASGVGETTHTVLVDNQRLVALAPSLLSLSTRRPAGQVSALVVGPNLHLLMPLEGSRVELRIPGGSAVPLDSFRALGNRRSHSPRMLVLRFDRAAMIASTRAAIATGALPERARRVRVGLFVDGVEIGHKTLRLRTESRRGCRR